MKLNDFTIPNISNEKDAVNFLMNTPIIFSLLDTDFYKFTMQQVVFHYFKDLKTKFEFKNRNDIPLVQYKDIINKQLDFLCNLKFKSNELEFLSNLKINGEKIFKSDYIESLIDFQLDRSKIQALEAKNNHDIDIKISKDTWFQNIMFEVYTLSIVNGVHSIIEASKKGGVHKFIQQGLNKLDNKIDYIQNQPLVDKFNLVDFGTRRRFLDVNYQLAIFDKLKERIPNNIKSTSNVYVAYKHNIVPSGTMAHEYLQAMQSVVGIKDSQKYAFETWQKEYGKNKLGIALSDILGMNPFFVSFDKNLTETYQGCRHDSGDPLIWGDKVIKHYKENNVDPTTKNAVFSDGLNIPYAFEILNYFDNRIISSFGIGTNLTNDVGLIPLQSVLKMVWCNGQSVAKLSDNPAKSMCKDVIYMKEIKAVAESMNTEYIKLYQ